MVLESEKVNTSRSRIDTNIPLLKQSQKRLLLSRKGYQKRTGQELGKTEDAELVRFLRIQGKVVISAWNWLNDELNSFLNTLFIPFNSKTVFATQSIVQSLVDMNKEAKSEIISLAEAFFGGLKMSHRDLEDPPSLELLMKEGWTFIKGVLSNWEDVNIVQRGEKIVYSHQSKVLQNHGYVSNPSEVNMRILGIAPWTSGLGGAAWVLLYHMACRSHVPTPAQTVMAMKEVRLKLYNIRHSIYGNHKTAVNTQYSLDSMSIPYSIMYYCKRGKKVIQIYEIGTEMEMFIQGLGRRMLTSYGPENIPHDQKFRMLTKALKMVQRWIIPSFIGVIDVLFDNSTKEICFHTLVNDAWEFIKKTLSTWAKPDPGNKSGTENIFLEQRINHEQMVNKDWSNPHEVLSYYMHVRYSVVHHKDAYVWNLVRMWYDPMSNGWPENLKSLEHSFYQYKAS